MPSEREECFASAKQAAATTQKDDIVIMLWSFGYRVHVPLYQLLTGTQKKPNFWKFVTQHIAHPKSGDQVLLVSAPNPGWYFDTQTQKGLQYFLSHGKQMQVRFVGHILVHDSTREDLLIEDWDNLKKIFEGAVEMRDVIFLSEGWKQVKGANYAGESEARTLNALKYEVERGLIISRLLGNSVSDAWLLLEQVSGWGREVFCWTEGDEKWKEDMRVLLIQTDINNLQVELQQTERGRWILNWFQEIWKKEQDYMVETLAKIDQENNSILKRCMLEAADWEYMMYRKKIWSLFEECGFINVPVGHYLKSFYGFEVFPPKPPSLKIRKSVFKHLLEKLGKKEKV